MTIGGYSPSDMVGGHEGIEWYKDDVTNAIADYPTWMLPINSMNVTGINLLEAPTTPTGTERLVNDDSAFPCYAHFNTGYPFIGVDENVGALIETELKAKRPDVSCDYQSSYNTWDICYYREACDYETFKTNLQFNLGTNTTFVMSLNDLMFDYIYTDYWGNKYDYCGIGI